MPKLDLDFSSKRVAISKTNAQMVIILGIASFITIFCLVAANAVWSQTRYQARVTSASEKAHKQLLANIQAANQLTNTFNAFQASEPNIIGGSSSSNSNNGGTNAQIILDALPPKYDFPALITSIQKLLNGGNVPLSSITGTDEQLTEETDNSSPNPSPVPMPFNFSVENTNFDTIEQTLDLLQRSIRPIQVDTINVTGGGNDMTLSVTAHSYYQPGKQINITQETVK